MQRWRKIVWIAAATTTLTAVLAGGCPGDAASDPASSASPFTTVSIPRVGGDTTVRLASLRDLTGCVPAAFAINDADQGKQFFARVAKSASYGDCFVARPRMDWTLWGPNGAGRINDDLINAVLIARQNGVKSVVIEIDPVADRRNVGVLPPELAGKNFADPEVRDPIKRFAVEVALQLRPQYMAISVEMNGYYESNPVDFENYVTLHKETYDLVKAANPEVQFFAALNLEALQGFFGNLDPFSDHPPQWFLIDKLEPKLDAIAFATLPFAFFFTPLQLPDDYLSRIEQHTTRDILLTEIGWPGAPGHPVYTPETQRDYLIMLANQIDRLPQVRMVVWTTLFDADPDSAELVTSNFKTLGLFDYLDTPKPALEIWSQIHALPYQP